MGKHPILYTFRRCPYAMRARMGIYAAGMQVELREIVLRDKPAHMLEISPKGTVPVLLLPNGKIIDESLDILKYALLQNDPDKFLEGDTNQTERLITYNDGPFKKALDRYKYPARYKDENCSDARDIGENFLKELNDILSAQNFLAARHKTMADIAIFPFIRQFANVDRDWFDALPYPALQNWLEDNLTSNLFIVIMKKFTVWSPEAYPLYWP